MWGCFRGSRRRLFKALGHPVRIRILELLREGEQSVSSLAEAMEVEMSTVSQHLAILRGRGLVSGRKEGTTVFYTVIDPQVFDLLDTARAMFQRQLSEMQELAGSDQ